MIDRTKNWPGKATETEIKALNYDAKQVGLSPSNYVRKCLGFPGVEMGPPAGNRNAVKSKRKARRVSK